MRGSKKVIAVFALVFLIIGGIPLGRLTFQGPGTVFAEDGEKKAETEETGKEKEGKEGEAPQPCPECPECPDPAKVVLRGLEEKKQAVAEAQKTLDQQRKELETYEAQIDEKLIELAAVKKQIEEDMARLKEEKSRKDQEREADFEAKMARLVKMYAGMKPKNAALIVDKMELEVAQEIFMRMREASASQILAFVDSAKAAKISERLAFRRK